MAIFAMQNQLFYDDIAMIVNSFDPFGKTLQ